MGGDELVLTPSDIIDVTSALLKLQDSVNQSPFNDPVTPTAGGNQSNAAQLSYGLNPIVAPANGYDTVQLPSAVAGKYVRLVALGTSGGGTGNPTAVWAQYGTSDSINGVANASDYFDFGSSSFPSTADFFCFADGQWSTQLTAD